MERIYLLNLSELIDRLSIVTLKSIKLGANDEEKKEAYEKEAHLIMHDIDLLMKEQKDSVMDWGKFLRGILLVGLSNEVIWANETFVRMNKDMSDEEALKRLKFTHSVNAVRMHGGNMVQYELGGLKDLNSDRLNHDITKQMGYNFSGCFR